MSEDDEGELVPITIKCDDDQHATRAAAVLEALGYDVTREMGEDAGRRHRWAVDRARRRYRLTQREGDLLALVVEGLNNQDAGKRLTLSRATIKWHMHNLFTKMGTVNREGLLRVAFQLGGAPPLKSDEGAS